MLFVYLLSPFSRRFSTAKLVNHRTAHTRLIPKGTDSAMQAAMNKFMVPLPPLLRAFHGHGLNEQL